MKKTALLLIAVLIATVSCQPAPTPTLAPTPPLPAGMIEGWIRFNNKLSVTSVHPCNVSQFQSGTRVDAASVDWSKVVSKGWDSAKGFRWEGDVRAPGFFCTLDSSLKYEMGQIVSGKATRFSIRGVPPGKFAIVVIGEGGSFTHILSNQSGELLMFDLTTDRGMDIGEIAIGNK